MKIGFIGAGKVGFSLGRYLSAHGITLGGYYSRNPESAREAAEFTGTGFFSNMEDLAESCTMIFLTVSDDAIAPVWDKLRTMRLTDRIVCHCSGVLSSEILSDCGQNVRTFSVHPLLAVNDRLHSYKEFSNALFTIEGIHAEESEPAALLRSCGNRVVILRAQDKVRYHAAAVLGSNLVLGLAQCAIEELSRCGFTTEEARTALAPFIQANVAHLGGLPIEQCLTGPVERGDSQTVERHLEVLDSANREIYRLLSQKALEIAKRRNPGRDYRTLGGLLDEPAESS